MSFNKLKGLMTEKKVSQEKLASKIGITTQSLNAKLNGRSQFTLGEVIKITNYLDINNPQEIFFTENIPNMQHNIQM